MEVEKKEHPTKELREKISDLIDNNFENIQSDMDQLEPKERLDFLSKLFEYSLPKLNRTEIETNSDTQIIWNETKNYAPVTLADWYDDQRGQNIEKEMQF